MSDREASAGSRSTTGLARELGLMGLVATGICAMLGAAINVMPFMIQRSVPGIGPWVLPAYLFAAVPAVLAALAYASLGSAMPRAGGSYIYASRALSPYWGFVASFSQWFGLSIAIGVVSYILIPFLRDIAGALEWVAVADALDTGAVRVGLALAFLWTFVLVNVRGLELYERTLVPMMFLMFALGAVVIVAGFAFDHGDFAAALSASEGRSVPEAVAPALEPRTLLAASVLLFATFIGFDSIAQAGGEAKNPGRNLPLAIGLAITIVGGFYFLFTAAVYHAVPWSFIAAEAQVRDLTAPGLLGYLLPAGWTVVIVGGAAVALINDLPAMLLAVSRMMFAWAEDGIFPKRAAAVHPRRRTPHVAIIASGIMASVGIVGSHLAGDFFLGIDILVISMLVNFGLMCLALLTLPRRNPDLAARVSVLTGRTARTLVGGAGVVVLGTFLVVQVMRDLTSEVAAWYFHPTWVWLLVMAVASGVYWREMAALRTSGADVERIFRELPPE
ncbi:MAG: APC family permease [Gammaproteobacteria bacterium]|nr:APC family permease [Gammaproteobacteria bacterium]MYF60674.1 APC family permease [Gammaproteobacteria bacterium]